MESPVRPHPQIRINVGQIGQERAPIMVIDQFISNAGELVAQAGRDHPFQPFPPSLAYPGVQAVIDPTYALAVYQILRDPIRQVFGLGDRDVVNIESDYRMVTHRPEGRHIRQLVPHYDRTSPSVIVVLHYLAARPYGGTSMYRHRQTGFELVTPERVAQFEETLAGELQDYQPVGYDIADSPLFEKIASVPAQFNRAIVYRGACLHSGDIDADFPFDEDPRTGRLTASTFLIFGLPNRPLPPLEWVGRNAS